MVRVRIIGMPLKDRPHRDHKIGTGTEMEMEGNGEIRLIFNSGLIRARGVFLSTFLVPDSALFETYANGMNYPRRYAHAPGVMMNQHPCAFC